MSEDVKTKYYRLAKPEYHDAVKAITGFTGFDFVNNISDGRPYFPVVSGKYPTLAYIKLKEAGVIDLWFEEVDLLKESQFRKGDWIELDNNDATRKLVGLITNVSIKEDSFKDKYVAYELKFPFEDDSVISRYEAIILTKNPVKLEEHELLAKFKTEMKKRGYFDKVYIDFYGQDSVFYIGEGLSDVKDVAVIMLYPNSNIIGVYWEVGGVSRSYRIWSNAYGWNEITKKYEEPKTKEVFKYKVGDFVVCDRNLKGFNQKTFVGLVVACKTDPDISTYYDIMPVNYKLDGEILGSIYWNYGVISRQEHILLKKASYDEILGAFDQEARYRGLYPVGKENAIAKYYSHFDSPTFEVSRTNPVTKLRECYILWSKHSGWVKKSPFKESVETKASGDLVNFTDSCSDCDIDGCSSRGKDDKIDEKVAEAFKTLLDWLDEN